MAAKSDTSSPLAGLDRRRLQDFCEHCAVQLGTAVSFAGPGGRILASSDHGAIGKADSIAADIMAGGISEHTVSRAQALRAEGLREGTALAIDFRGRRVAGVIVHGAVQSARGAALIARNTVLSMLQDAEPGARPEPGGAGATEDVCNYFSGLTAETGGAVLDAAIAAAEAEASSGHLAKALQLARFADRAAELCQYIDDRVAAGDAPGKTAGPAGRRAKG